MLHGSTLLGEVLSPISPRLVITLGSFQRCGRPYSFTSENYPPDVDPGQWPPYDSCRTADMTHAGADNASLPNSEPNWAQSFEIAVNPSHSDGSSGRLSITFLTARSRSLGEERDDPDSETSSQRIHSPAFPARFTFAQASPLTS